MTKFAIFLLTFVFSAWFIGKIRFFCQNQGMVDEVNARSSHATPTVRGGGILFVVIGISALIIINLLTQPPFSPFLWAISLGGILVAITGWLDDKNSLPPLPRFLAQSLAVAISLFFLPQMFETWMPFWVEKTLFFFAWLWFINLFNFLDGIDGYAACEAAFISLVLILFIPSLEVFLLVLLSTSLGFLRLNFSKKQKIFMGDVGSLYLGYTLGGILFYGLLKSPGELLPYLFTLPLLFTFDATFTLIKRILQGKKPWEAHKEHFYQRAVLVGYTHKQITMRSVGINFIILAFIIIGVFLKSPVLTLFLSLAMLSGIAYYIRYLEGKK